MADRLCRLLDEHREFPERHSPWLFARPTWWYPLDTGGCWLPLESSRRLLPFTWGCCGDRPFSVRRPLLGGLSPSALRRSPMLPLWKSPTLLRGDALRHRLARGDDPAANKASLHYRYPSAMPTISSNAGPNLIVMKTP